MASDGFLSRWARRKQEVNEGKPVEAEPRAEAAPVEADVPAAATPNAEPQPTPPPPTLEEAALLTPESDFRRFVAPNVAPEVKNAAVKKLFADPRYNVRDMMDVYADDYSQPDPIPESMLKQMVAAQFLKLFEEKPTPEGDAPGEAPDDVSMQTVAELQQAPEVPEPPNADPDLRLQQDDAARPEGGRDGIERNAAAPHEPVPPGSGELPEGDPGR